MEKQGKKNPFYEMGKLIKSAKKEANLIHSPRTLDAIQMVKLASYMATNKYSKIMHHQRLVDLKKLKVMDLFIGNPSQRDFLKFYRQVTDSAQQSAIYTPDQQRKKDVDTTEADVQLKKALEDGLMGDISEKEFAGVFDNMDEFKGDLEDQSEEKKEASKKSKKDKKK